MEKNGKESSGFTPARDKKPKSAKPRLDGSRGKSKHYKKVSAEINKVAEAVKDNRAKEEALGDDQTAMDAKLAKMKNNAELEILKQDIRKLYLQELANLMHHDIAKQIGENEREFLLSEAEDKAAVHTVKTLLAKAQSDEHAAQMALHVAKVRKECEIDLAKPRTDTEREKVNLELYKMQQENIRAKFSEATKTNEAVNTNLISGEVANAKTAAAKLETIKLETQLEETKLRKAPVDHYQIDSSEDFRFKYKVTKFQYDLRIALFCFCAFIFTLIASGLGMPIGFVLVCSALTANSAVLVGAQVYNPLLRYKCGNLYKYRSTNQFATVPGKPLFDGVDVRMENDRRDLVKYEGLVRFFEVKHKYVAPVKFLTYEIPFINIYREKITVTAVAIGMLQQVITKRVSFCDEETWVRSKIEYNSSNMTNVNIDKELMFIAHPVTNKKHGFAVFQETVDVAWGWVMSQKQRSKHVPRPRAVLSQPK